jgi:DNA mismatch endonuclease, patch repair protein
VLDEEQRRLCMSRNRGRDTKPEVTLRKACWALGLRYVLHPRLPGCPDFILPRHRVAVFVDGCFWHGCPEHYHAPSTRADFWARKIDATRKRDASVRHELEAGGWKVVRVWEHSVRRDLPLAVSEVMKRTCVR